jgi:biotin synthase-related radical SAM superfamily protein
MPDQVDSMEFDERGNIIGAGEEVAVDEVVGAVLVRTNGCSIRAPPARPSLQPPPIIRIRDSSRRGSLR